MGKVRVACFGLTLDGFSAGADQSLQNPLGVHGTEMMDWFFPTDVFRKMHGDGESGETGVGQRYGGPQFRERRRVGSRPQHVRPGVTHSSAHLINGRQY